MLNTQLEAMTVKELRAHIKQEDFEVVGAWKMRKEDLIENIIFNRETRQMQAAMQRMRQEEEEIEEIEIEETQEIEVEEVEETQEKTSRRVNKKAYHVVLENGEELEFASNKDFTEYFNAKHETNFRNDVPWYIVRNRNKKAKQIFQIKEITQ